MANTKRISVLLILMGFFLAPILKAEFPPAYGVIPDYLTSKKGELGNPQTAAGDYACTTVDGSTPGENAIKLGTTITQNCQGSVTRTFYWYSDQMQRNKPYSLTGGYWLVCCNQSVAHAGRRRY